MAEITTCTSCGKKNRLPAGVRGKPRCASCHAPLAWIVDASDATFDDAVDTTLPVVVDLWAPWCAPCRMVTPAVERLARERAGRLKVVKVDVDTPPKVAARYRVQGIPTLLLLEGARVVDRRTGALSSAALADWVDAHVSPA